MGFLDAILKRNSELSFMFDTEFFVSASTRIHMKHLAVETCANFLARTISQSEFRVKADGVYVKDELYYKMNVRPNKNQSATEFWEQVIINMIYDNEVLIIQSDDEDLLIADDFTHNEYAVYEDTFTDVTIGDYTFKRVFKQSEVLHMRYANKNLQPLIDGLYKDYADLFSSVLGAQKRKNQIRSTVSIDSSVAKDAEKMAKLQAYIDKLYKSIRKNTDVAVVPEQPGFGYKEHASGTGNQSVDEINKVTNGFLDQIAMAIGIPAGLLHGDLAGVKEMTKNYTVFTVKPMLKKIRDECNSKFFTMKEYLSGSFVEVKIASYESIFDLAVAIDKLVSSGTFNRREIRGEAGFDTPDGEEFDKFYITKNYMEEGTENSEPKTE